MKKYIKLSKSDLDKYNKACDEPISEFTSMEDGTVVFERKVRFGSDLGGLFNQDVFDDGFVMDVQVITCSDDCCYVMAVLYLNGIAVERTDPSSRLDDEFSLHGHTVEISQEVG